MEAHAAGSLPRLRRSIKGAKRTALTVGEADVVVALTHDGGIVEAGVDVGAVGAGDAAPALKRIQTRGADQVLIDDRHTVLVEAVETVGADTGN